MTKQPSSACLTPTTRGELETTSATRPPPAVQHGERRDQEALTGFPNHYPDPTDRAVKASPTGGLRPALTALP